MRARRPASPGAHARRRQLGIHGAHAGRDPRGPSVHDHDRRRCLPPPPPDAPHHRPPDRDGRDLRSCRRPPAPVNHRRDPPRDHHLDADCQCTGEECAVACRVARDRDHARRRLGALERPYGAGAARVRCVGHHRAGRRGHRGPAATATLPRPRPRRPLVGSLLGRCRRGPAGLRSRDRRCAAESLAHRIRGRAGSRRRAGRGGRDRRPRQRTCRPRSSSVPASSARSRSTRPRSPR